MTYLRRAFAFSPVLKNMQSIYTWRAIAQKKPEDFVDASFVTERDKSGYIDSLYK